jgi:hypothetical protein
VAGTRPRHVPRANRVTFARRRVHDLFPVPPIAIADDHGDGRPNRLASAQTRKDLDAIRLYLHTAAAPITLLSAAQITIHISGDEWKAGRYSFDYGDKGLTV